MSIELVMPSNHLILCCPLLLLPSIFPGIRVFSNESALHIMRPKYWSFSFNISPSNECSGLIKDGLVGSACSPSRGSQESSPTPQFKSITSSSLSFFTVQLSHPYMTTGKAIALTRWTFAGKVMSLLFNMLSRLVGRNINNLRYADDTTLMAESKEELKSLLNNVKEESEKLA